MRKTRFFPRIAAMILILFLPLISVAQEAPRVEWNWSNLPFPEQRMGHVAVYDSLNNRMIIFGGSDNWDSQSYDYPNNTIYSFDFDAGRWARLITTSEVPPANGDFWNWDLLEGEVTYGRVYRTSTQELIVIKKQGNTAYSLNLNSLGWSILETTGEKPISVSAIILDGANDRIIALGADRSVWSLNLTNLYWSQIYPSGSPPSSRTGTSLIYDSRNQRMILFGGYGPNFVNDLWSLGLEQGKESWQQLFPAGALPSGRNGHTAIYNSVNHQMVIFGGHNHSFSNVLNDTWVLDLVSLGWSEITSLPKPEARFGHSAVYNSTTQEMVVFGGSYWNNQYRQGCYKDGWSFDLTTQTWKVWPGSSARWAPSAIWDNQNNRMIIFGGLGVGQMNLESLDPTTGIWTSLEALGSEPPAMLRGHAAIYDSLANRMIIFGGWTGPSTEYNNLWALDLTNLIWSELSSSGTLPSARVGHTAIYDSRNYRMIVFGGSSGNTCYNDLWSLDLSNLTWSGLNASGSLPSARDSHTAIFDSQNNRMIVFGGEDNAGSVGDLLWSLDLSSLTWTQLSPSGDSPSPRFLASAVYDSTNGQMILFGGRYADTNYFNDCYLLDLSLGSEFWTKLSFQSSPSGRYGHKMVLNPQNRQVILFGGHDGKYYLNDVWILFIPVGFSTAVEGTEKESDTPKAFVLSQNYPNPFNPTTKINFALPNTSYAALEVFNSLGQKIETLFVDEKRKAGRYQVTWDGTNFPSGIYFYRLETEGFRKTMKMTLIK